MEEFNLSSNMIGASSHTHKDGVIVYLEKDVKEFIRRLKKRFDYSKPTGLSFFDATISAEQLFEEIDRLAGEAVI